MPSALTTNDASTLMPKDGQQDTAQAPAVLDPSTVKITGLPDAPPVAVRVAWPPTVPVPGPVKLIAWAPGLTVMDCWTWGAAAYPFPAAWLASITHVPVPV